MRRWPVEARNLAQKGGIHELRYEISIDLSPSLRIPEVSAFLKYLRPVDAPRRPTLKFHRINSRTKRRSWSGSASFRLTA
jgi:hypothetical protein